jgi:hypothetical protein
MSEMWVPIPDFEETHEISTQGRVRSLDRLITQMSRWGTPVTCRYRGRLITPYVESTKDGHPNYLKVKLKVAGTVTRARVHLLMAKAFMGPANGRQVRHLNGNHHDNRWPENLAYGSNQDNVDDMMQHGTHWQLQKTSCPSGHELTGPNLIPGQLKRGWRQCLACDRTRKRIKNRPELDFQTESDREFQKLVG